MASDPHDRGHDELRHATAGFDQEPSAESRAPMAVVFIGSLPTSTFRAPVVTPLLHALLDDLQSQVFRPVLPVTPELAKRVAMPVAATAPPMGVGASRTASGNGHGNGQNGANDRRVEPGWAAKDQSQ